MIPQNNPAAGYAENKSQIDAAIARVMDSGWFVLGKEVENFERAFATYVGVEAGIGVASGTDAIEIALRACDIGTGDTVFTVSHTAVATVVAIERTGANVALVDVDPNTYTMSPANLEQMIQSVVDRKAGRPAAVVPVHLYGHMAPMIEIVEIANRYGLAIVEDCAQAHGAAINGRQAGTWGRAATFSFYPTKNLPAFGDGGMVVTNDDTVTARARQLRQYGWSERFISVKPGINSRLDEIQAAILNVRLQTLDQDNDRRRQIALSYSKALEGGALGIPQVMQNASHVYHQYVVQCDNRDALREFLAASDIGTAIHYPSAVHQQPAYADRLIGCDQLAVTDKITQRILSLPMYPQLNNDQVEAVVGRIHEWLATSAGNAK